MAAIAAAAIMSMGCGGDSSPAKSTATDRGRPPATGAPQSTRARPQDVAVIRNWSDTLSAGKESEAARFFADSVIVANSTSPLRLETPGAVRYFNRSLPCGAKLLEARRIGRYTVATFKLMDRPGGACRNGAGHKAATAFTFRDGKIAEWRRVEVPATGTPEPDPVPDPAAPPPEKA